MKLISFSETWPQILARTKTVTRRIGCADWKPGERRQAVQKMRGLKKGQKVVRGPVLECVLNERQRIDFLICEPFRGIALREMDKEGFPGMNPCNFIAFFCKLNHCKPDQIVNRIMFKYVDA
jgi:hypothetical protein